MPVPSSVAYYFPFNSGDTSPITSQGYVTDALTLASGSVVSDGSGGYVLGDGTQTPNAWYGGAGSGPTLSAAFTIEAWVNIYPTTSGDLFGDPSVGLFVDGTNLYVRYQNGGTNYLLSGTPTGWTHIAVVSNGTAISTFINGVLTDGPRTLTTSFGAGGQGVRVGSSVNITSGDSQTQYDDIIVSDVARYTSNFTPAARGSAFSGGGGAGSATLTSSINIADVVVASSATAATQLTSSVQLASAAFASTAGATAPTDVSSTVQFDESVFSGLIDVVQPAYLFGDVTLDDLTVSSTVTVTDAQILAIQASMPAPTATAYSGASFSAVAPVFTVEMTGSKPEAIYISASTPYTASLGSGATIRARQAYTATATATAPAVMRVGASLSYSVEMTATVVGRLNVDAVAPAFSAAMFGGAQITAAAPAFSVSVGMTADEIMGVTASMPYPTASITAHQAAVMRVSAVMPMLQAVHPARVVASLPGYSAVSAWSHTFVPTYEAYVLNLNQPLDDNPRNNFEAKVPQMTRYTNWPFVQIARSGGAHYAIGPSGVYQLGGTTDNGTAIDWSFETCVTDFGDPHRKTVASAYLSGQSPATLTYTIRSGDDTDRLYDHITTRITQKRNHRQKFGLGRRVRYYSFGLAGQGELVMDGLEFEVIGTTRRV